MDQQRIDTIEAFLGVPLIHPEYLDPIDAKELAAALTRLDADATEAREEVEDASWDEDKDGAILERLEDVTKLLRDAIDTCESCNDENPCQRCAAFSQWLQNE
jgi:hypothetical protein